MDFKEIIEPLRYLFKDEVRKAGLELGIPEIPGIPSAIPRPRTWYPYHRRSNGRKSTASCRMQTQSTVRRSQAPGVDKGLGQYFAALTNMRSVGVMGDFRTYDYAVALRAVNTIDFMTAGAAELPWEVLSKVTNRIVNEVKGVNRVLYDCTGKPPATIEFE